MYSFGTSYALTDHGQSEPTVYKNKNKKQAEMCTLCSVY